MDSRSRLSRHNVFEQTFTFLCRKPLITLVTAIVAVCFFLWFQAWPHDSISRTGNAATLDTVWNVNLHANNLRLDEAQCSAAFPKLFTEVDRAAEGRRKQHISVQELDSIVPKNGYVRAMIYDQQLYVIAVQGSIYSRERATLQAIQRAILSAPVPLPNIEFAFNTDDVIFEKVALWGYARRSSDEHIWLIPDFGYWSWPETKVGTMHEVQLKAEEMEINQQYGWSEKVSKLLWRGATMGLPLRERLLDVTKDKPWADVVALNWHDTESMTHDLKSMAEHCQYKWLMHTEGNSYSGRLKYLQNCQSVIIAHEMDWIQHHHPLMQKSGPDQNYVEVSRNLDDLESTILALDNNPAKAQRIAANNVKTFRSRYLTPAAEVCYWRYLMHAWSEVSFKPDFYKLVDGKKVWRGLPVESYLLEGRLEWEPY